MGDPGRPVLIVVAGPNGAGKTTVTKALLQQFGASEGFVYVNPDDIAAERFSRLPVEEANIAAANEAERIRIEAVRNQRNLAFETVLSMPDKVAFVKSAIAAGYFVRFAFVATDDPEVNIRRIRARVGKGGHDVPAEKIVARFNRSIANCAELIPLVDRAYVLDNSVDGQIARKVFRTMGGKLAKVYTEPDSTPEWCGRLANGVWGINLSLGWERGIER